MKNIIPIIALFIIISCNENKELHVMKNIDPNRYELSSFGVKDTSNYGNLKEILAEPLFVNFNDDGTFNSSKVLNDLIFKDTLLSYKVKENKLFLYNEKIEYYYEILELDINYVKLNINNNYFNQITLLKPKGQRTQITRHVELTY